MPNYITKLLTTNPYLLVVALAVAAGLGALACAVVMLKRDGKSKADKAAKVVDYFFKYLRPVVGDERVMSITLVIAGVLKKAAESDDLSQAALTGLVEEQAAANNVQIGPNDLAAIMLMVNMALDDQHANNAFKTKAVGFQVASEAGRRITQYLNEPSPVRNVFTVEPITEVPDGTPVIEADEHPGRHHSDKE